MFVRAHVGKFLDENPELEPQRSRVLEQLATVDTGAPMFSGDLEVIFRGVPSTGSLSLIQRFEAAMSTLPYTALSCQYLEGGERS